MQAYWAIIEGEGDNYGAFVPDVGGAVGAGSSPEEALAGVRESLAVMLADLEMRGEPLPAPTPKEQLDVSEFGPEEPYRFALVEPASLSPVSLAIEGALRRSGVSKAELARRMNIPRSTASRITDPFYWGHSSDTLRRVAEALNADMRVTFQPKETVGARSA